MFRLVSGLSRSVKSTEKMLSCGERTDGFGKMDKVAHGGERSNILEWKVRGLTSFFSGREESRWSEKKKGRREKRKEKKKRNAPLRRSLTNDGKNMKCDPNGGRGLFLLFLPLLWLERGAEWGIEKRLRKRKKERRRSPCLKNDIGDCRLRGWRRVFRAKRGCYFGTHIRDCLLIH